MPRFPFAPSGDLWRFDSKRFSVRFYVSPEDIDPKDSFSDRRDVAYARQGGAHWFTAWVVVWTLDRNGKPKDALAWDVLGGCSYGSFREFYTAHRDPDHMNRNCSLMRAERGERSGVGHYFPDMVSNAIAGARAILKNARAA